MNKNESIVKIFQQYTQPNYVILNIKIYNLSTLSFYAIIFNYYEDILREIEFN